jgi:predicted ferric reductase
MKISDFKGVTKTIKVEFESAENIEKDYYEIKLKKPEGLKWKAGEHAIFSIPNKKIQGKKWRAFSIASTPKENVILLGTRTGTDISSFKKTLIELKKGDVVKMRGPFGWFTEQDKTTPVVMIALGVGITPVRALLTTFEHHHDRKVDVVYSSTDVFLFKNRIQEIIDHNKSFNIVYPNTIEDTQSQIDRLSKQYGNHAYYYVSGSSKAIKSVQIQLNNNNVK